MAAPAPVRILLDNSMGASLIGVIVSAVLYGMSCIQMWYYYNTYQRDPKWIKLLVAACWCTDTIHLAMISHSVYYYVISNYANPIALADMVWSILLEAPFNGLTAFMVQGFLTMRVWRLSHKSVALTLLIGAMVVAEFILILVWTVLAMQLTTFVQLTSLKKLSACANAVAAIADVSIALILSFLLQRSRTGFRTSGNVISRLIFFTMNTGLLTALCAVASFVSITVWGDALIYAAFYFCIGRLYCNTLLATLNYRNGVHGQANDSENASMSLRVVSKGTSAMETTKRGNISIKIDTTHEVEQDNESTLVDQKASYKEEV